MGPDSLSKKKKMLDEAKQTVQRQCSTVTLMLLQVKPSFFFFFTIKHFILVL